MSLTPSLRNRVSKLEVLNGLAGMSLVAGVVLRPSLTEQQARAKVERARGDAAVLYIANLGRYRL